MNNRAVKKYIRTIKKTLPFVYNNRKRIINDIKSDIAEYAKENESCTYEELIDAFGSSEDIANEYMSETISKREFTKVRACYTVFSAIAIASSLCMFALVVCNINQTKNLGNTNIVDTKIIEDDEGFHTEIYEMNGDSFHEIIPSKEEDDEGFRTEIYEINGDSTREIIIH